MTVIAPDVSEFQTKLTDAFGRRFLIMRVSFGAHYADAHFLANASKAADLYRRGQIDGVILYVVYLSSATPQEQYRWTWNLIGPTVPPWLAAIMIDVERWGGTSYSISGDHSKQLNTLYGLHAHKMGAWSACIGYGNAGDLAAIWPRRDARCKVIVASYSSQLTYKRVRGAIGQQYSDGQKRWAVPRIGGKDLPRATAPFGPCDHNVFPGFRSAASLRAFLRPAKAAKPVKPKPAPVATKPAAPTKPTAPAPARRWYPTAVPAAALLTSPNGAYCLNVTDTGVVEVRHAGHHIHTMQGA